MGKFKMPFALLCALLIEHHVQAVVNKATLKVPLTNEEEKTTKVKAEDRISNTFASLSGDYGQPFGSSFNGPVPVYGPPELTGNVGPTPIYPPLPPELPPPLYGPPAISYGPPQSIKPQYGPPKQSFGSQLPPLLPKPSYGLPNLHYGPPKHFTLPSVSFSSLRLPTPQYGLPLKFVPQQYISSLPTSQHLPLKSGHGPPIPLSLETYGPPPSKLAIQFNPQPHNEYGPPLPPAPAPQSQYGPPTSDLFESSPPVPPPGFPAPPTPPDIKYDGWQPIAGLTSSPSQSGPPSDMFGPPTETKYSYVHSSSASGSDPSPLSLISSIDSNVPNDSYGVPIHNPEAQNLKTSVHESSASSERNGLPPPPLPQYEPLYNNQDPDPSITTTKSTHYFGQQQQQQQEQEQQQQQQQQQHQQQQQQQQQESLQYGSPNIESAVKSAGFELLPTTGVLNTAISLPSGIPSYNYNSNSVNTNPATFHSESIPHSGDSHALQNIENNQPLPQPTPLVDYSQSLNTPTFGQPGREVALLSPPLLGSYGVPPLSSYSFNRAYPITQGGQNTPIIGVFANPFYKYGQYYHRFNGPFRQPSPPLDILMPPRSREPIKFRESIPAGLLSNINQYLPPFTKHQKPHESVISLGQHLPNHHAPISFHHSSGSNNIFSGQYSSPNSFAGYNLNSPIAAPHVQYGTPLSFRSFNTPAPHLTYGAPNFGPPTSFISMSSGFGSNLYTGVGNALTTTYGTPIVNAPLSLSGGNDCNSLQPLVPVNRVLSSNEGLHSSGGLSSKRDPLLSNNSPSNGELHLSGGLSSKQESPLSVNPSSNEEFYSNQGLSSGNKYSNNDLSYNNGLQQNSHSNEKLQFSFENRGTSIGGVSESPASDVSNSLSTGNAENDLSDGQQNKISIGNELPFEKPFNNFLGGPSVSTLELQDNQEQKTNLKDSYGNPIEVTYDTTKETTNSAVVNVPSVDVSNDLSMHSFSQPHDTFSTATSLQHDLGISAEALTASLTAQGFGQGKSLESNKVDASQFLKSDEGSKALSFAHGLTVNDDADGFEVQGSNGIYRLQIQAADGGSGTENSDGSIRHEQVLSDGLLQNILAAIEQPENSHLQMQALPALQPLNTVLDEFSQDSSNQNEHFVAVDKREQNDGIHIHIKQASDLVQNEHNSKNQPIALFFDTKYRAIKREVRSVSRDEAQVAVDKKQNNGNTKSS